MTRPRLKSTDLRRATIVCTDWHLTKLLDRARVGSTILLNPQVRDLVVTHHGTGQSYAGCDLKGVNLVGANLNDADLAEADISGATLRDATLERANLAQTQLLATDLTDAILTGACIQNWQINRKTNLHGVQCDYIYRDLGWEEGEWAFTQRLPADPSRCFAPGEFTQLFQKIANAIELIFHHGMDWEAFAYAFNETNLQLQSTSGGELNLREFKVLGDGLVSLTVETPAGADVGQIEAALSEERVARIRAEGKLEGLQAAHNALLQMLPQMNNRNIYPGRDYRETNVSDQGGYFEGPVGSVDNKGTIGNAAGEAGGDQQQGT